MSFTTARPHHIRSACFLHHRSNCLELFVICSQRSIFTTSICATTEGTSFSMRLWLTMGTPPLCIIAKTNFEFEITGEVLTGRFSSSTTVVVHSASYPPGRANRVAVYQW